MKTRVRMRPRGDTTVDDTRETTFDADTYDDAHDQARASVPEGWDLLSVQTIG